MINPPPFLSPRTNPITISTLNSNLIFIKDTERYYIGKRPGSITVEARNYEATILRAVRDYALFPTAWHTAAAKRDRDRDE